MKQQLTNNDWQLLSEYLDGQISPRDRAALEKRLQNQAELRDGLEELRQTRILLRSVNKQRVPRNFTLTPSMVEQARPRPWLRLIPALNFTSATAALAVVVMMAISFLPGFNTAAAPAPTQAAALMAAENSSEPAPYGGTPVIIQWGGGAYGLGGVDGRGGGGGVEPPATIMQAAPSADLSPSQKNLDPQAPAESPEMANPEAPAANAALESVAVAAAPLEGSGPILGAVPPEQAQADNQRAIQDATSQRVTDQQAQNWVLPAIVLSLVAVLAALASYLLRRKARV
jgi:hypothetical protein